MEVNADPAITRKNGKQSFRKFDKHLGKPLI